MRVFKTRTFDRSMKRYGMTDRALRAEILEMAEGLIDADLGGQVVKKRVAPPGQGKRGGARTVVATKLAERWFFLYGFRKNERTNIDKDELRALQEVAKNPLGFDDSLLDIALQAGEIVEVRDGDEKA